jgi:hypothetical protein
MFDISLPVVWCLLALIVLQALAAELDGAGWLTRSQLNYGRIYKGYPLIAHGGIWADLLIITWLAAHFVGHYQIHYTSVASRFIALGSVILWLSAGKAWREEGKEMPEAHTHDGKTSVAGWIHLVYAIPVSWIIGLIYLTTTTPIPSVHSMIIYSTLLSVWAVLGIIKFSRQWRLTSGAAIQIVCSLVLIWVVTLGKCTGVIAQIF